MKVKTRNTISLLLLASLAALSSCNVEKQIAKQFIQQPVADEVLMFSPYYVFKSNLKEDIELDTSALTDEEIHQRRIDSSVLLKEISDSVFLSKYVNSYIEEMKALGYEVYTEDFVSEFMNRRDSGYVIHIAQLELEEYYMEYVDEEYIGGRYFKTEFDLNALNLNSWFELYRVNETERRKQVLFASHFISDNLYGSYTQYFFTGEVDYEYTIDSVKTEDVYELASYLGGLYASYTYDYILNKYIIKNMPEGRRPKTYWHYNRYNKRLYPAGEDRFELLDE